MAAHESLNMEEARIASGAQNHSRHPSTSTISGPLPTDSMVTVRLSDPPVASTLETSFQTNGHVTPLDGQVLGGQQRTGSMHTDRLPDTNENAVVCEEDSQDIKRQSTISLASIMEEEQSIRTSGTIRSRSDTSGSFSSNGSAQVDWDELEKSEEQAPRDEGSDEVHSPITDN